jgi:hypothetical protein
MKRIFIAVLIFGALIFFAANGLFRAAVPIAGSARTKSNELVDITLTSKNWPDRKAPWPQLKIPKSYLTNRGTWSGGDQELLVIQTGLPDLKPRPANIFPTAPQGTSEHAAQRNYWSNGIYLQVEAAPEGLTSLGTEYQLGKGARARGYVEQPVMHGLRRVHQVPCAADYAVAQANSNPGLNKPCLMDKPSREHFSLMEDGERALIKMDCSPPWTNDTGGCRARFLHRGLSVVLIFRRAELERWQEFVDGTKRMLDGFAGHNKKT